MVYGALVDLGTLGVLGWLLGRDGGTYRGLPGPPTTAWQVAFGALGVMAASVPAVVFSGQLTSALYGQDAIAPMFAVVDLPPWASAVSVLVVPPLQLWRTPRPSELHDELAGSAMCERVPGRRASRQSAGQAIRMAGCGGAVKPMTCGVLLGRRSRNAALATPWPAL
jgi:hypothetical protein